MSDHKQFLREFFSPLGEPEGDDMNIIELAKEAGFNKVRSYDFAISLERFAALVRAEATKAQPQGEPVAWGVDWGKDSNQSCVSIIKKHSDGTTEVVAIEHSPNPVRTKDLTEYELDELRFQNLNYLDYARAVIAADREKNK